MAESVVAIGLAANIVQLIIWATKIVKRIDEFQERSDKVPKLFRDIKTQLPLLLDTLGETQKQAEQGALEEKTQKALEPVIEGCKTECSRLEEVLDKVLPTASDHRLGRNIKAISSVAHERKVKDIIETVRVYIQNLTFYQTARAGRVNLGEYLHTARSRSPQPDSRKVFLVPFERDYDYIDRAGIIRELDDRRKTHRPNLSSQSNTAIAFVSKIQARMFSGFTPPALRSLIRQWDDLSPDAFQIVSDWLNDEDHGPWLMVLDSADDIDLFYQGTAKGPMKTHHPGIAQFVPRSPLGSIVVTTRDRRVAERLADRNKKNEPINVSPMSGSEAEELLRSKLPDELLSDSAAAVELVSALGNLPLAISQAAAFMTENGMDVSEYLAAFREDEAQVLSVDLGDSRRPSENGSSLLLTWQISFKQIREKEPRAAEILSLMSVLDRNAIPKSLLVNDSESATEFKFIRALGTLKAFSLVIAEKDGNFALHRLVQLSMRKYLEDEGTDTHWQEKALMAMVKHYPPGDFDNWKTCEALSSHAQIVIDYEFKSDECLLQRATIQHNLARFDGQQSRYALAHQRYEEVISTRKRILGSDHPDTLQGIFHLGEILYKQSKYRKAEILLRECLQGREGVLGPTHPDTLITVGQLAEILRGLKRYPEAEELYRRALAGKEDDLGDDINAMRNADNLGSVFRDAGDLEEAEKWVRFAFEARERSTGPTSPVTLESVSHLAYILRMRGRYDEAEAQNKRALAGFEKELGREHHFTLRSLDDLATVFWCQGKLKAAEEQNRRALRGLKNVLGPHHLRTLSSTSKLAKILHMQRRWAEAMDLLKGVLRVKQEEFGVDSPEAEETSREIEQLSTKDGEKQLESEIGRLTVEAP
ncbi:MAG: hypothetical protein Q9191_004358 [Dirinaria sp. TL-2023a]